MRAKKLGNDRRVDQTVLPNGHWVSTVELTIDHGFGGKPLWFETMVFSCSADGDVSSWTEEDCRRYSTREEAEAGHQEVVAEWSAK